MHHLPFTFEITLPQGIPTVYDNHITRSLSSMRGQYADQQAYDAQLAQEDVLLYEVYEIHRPESSGELLNGISIVHPGKVGDEYFMTKGHFHAVLETAEIYYCLAGRGLHGDGNAGRRMRRSPSCVRARCSTCRRAGRIVP